MEPGNSPRTDRPCPAQPFIALPWRHGTLADLRDDAHPTRIAAWHNDTLTLRDDATHYLFVLEGDAVLRCAAGRFTLGPGMYACVAGAGEVGGAGRGLVLSCLACHSLFMLGGPIEQRGRLRYIDGCTDTLLIPPVLRGEPCLNLLHIPPGTHQTRHTHPSLRAGVIVRGRGACHTPAGQHALEPGMAFLIPAGGEHSFHTEAEPLLVIAYHPDSDFGPTHEDHPMVNRTIVDGVAASHLPAIHTRNAQGER